MGRCSDIEDLRTNFSAICWLLHAKCRGSCLEGNRTLLSFQSFTVRGHPWPFLTLICDFAEHAATVSRWILLLGDKFCFMQTRRTDCSSGLNDSMGREWDTAFKRKRKGPAVWMLSFRNRVLTQLSVGSKAGPIFKLCSRNVTGYDSNRLSNISASFVARREEKVCQKQ